MVSGALKGPDAAASAAAADPLSVLSRPPGGVGGPTPDSLRAMTCKGRSVRVGVAERGSGSVMMLSVSGLLLQFADAEAEGSTSDSSPTSRDVSARRVGL